MPKLPSCILILGMFVHASHALCGELKLHVTACEKPVYVSLDMPAALNFELPGPCRLVEVDQPGTIMPGYLHRTMDAAGLPRENFGRLTVCIPPRKGGDSARRFRAERLPAGAAAPDSRFSLEDDGRKWIQLYETGKPVLRYNYGEISADYVPQNDPRGTRACYVHPLWGLGGEVLTDDFPKDHYHHHGLFWAWPRVEIAGRVYDLWKGLNIRHQFVRWLARDLSPVSAALACENACIADGRTVMLERVWLQAYRSDGNCRILDLDVFWIATKEPVTLRGAFGKGYGGITMRYAPRRHTSISTSEGAANADQINTIHNWADLTGDFPGYTQAGGVALFTIPELFDPGLPPAWLLRNFGAISVSWPQASSRTIHPGNPFRFSIRLYIHGPIRDVTMLRQAYEAYVAGAKSHWQ